MRFEFLKYHFSCRMEKTGQAKVNVGRIGN